MHRRKIHIIAILIFCVILIGITQTRQVFSVLRIQASEVIDCNITSFGKSGVQSISVDLVGEDLEDIVKTLENTFVRFDGFDPHMVLPTSCQKYSLFMQTITGKSSKLTITSNGYMFVGNTKYKLIGKTSLLTYLDNLNAI